jgi:hypothetical protein
MEYKNRTEMWDGNTIKRQDVRRRDEWLLFGIMSNGAVWC